jgi:hypothetical protein
MASPESVVGGDGVGGGVRPQAAIDSSARSTQKRVAIVDNLHR